MAPSRCLLRFAVEEVFVFLHAGVRCKSGGSTKVVLSKCVFFVAVVAHVLYFFMLVWGAGQAAARKWYQAGQCC